MNPRSGYQRIVRWAQRRVTDLSRAAGLTRRRDDQAEVASAPVRDGLAPQRATLVGNVDVLEFPSEQRLRVAGWALGSEAVDEVSVRVNGRHVASLPCRLQRDDVAAAYPGFPNVQHSGFDGEFEIGGLDQDVNEILVEAVNADGLRSSLLRRRVLASSHVHRWQALLDQRGWDEEDVFYFPIATSNVAQGGAAGIKDTFGPYESRTVRVGIRVQILYLRTTRGAAADYVFDPDFVADKRCNGRLIAEDGLHDVMRYAVEQQLPVLFTLNGGIWADSVCEAVEWDVNDALERDESLCQWNEKDQVMPDTALANLPGSIESPELGRSLSLNVYMEKVRWYKKRNLQQAASAIHRFSMQHPHLFIGVNLDADVYVNPFFEGAQWYDYNPATLRQFRHWLRGDGPYAGEGGDNVPDLSRYRRQQSVALADIDAWTGKRHASWDQVDAPRQFPTRTRKFWQDPWVGVWKQFRRHLVHLHYDELSQWVAETGIAANRIYSSQGFMPPGDLIDPLPVRLDSPAKNYDTGGMSIEGSVPSCGRLGAIIYGQSAINRVRMEGSASLFDEFRRYSPQWAVVEHNTGDLTQARRLATGQEAYRSLREVVNYGARFISSMAWNGSPGDTVGMAGFLGYTSLRRSPLEDAMQDFMLARAELPRSARLWTFGSSSCADDDGWTIDGEPAQPASAGRLALQLGEDGRAVLMSPDELAWSCEAHPLIVIEMLAGNIDTWTLSVQAQTADGQWHAVCAETPVHRLPRARAGMHVTVAADGALEFARMRLVLRGQPGATATLGSITLYPARRP